MPNPIRRARYLSWRALLACGACALAPGPWFPTVAAQGPIIGIASGWKTPVIDAELKLEGKTDDGREPFDEPRRDNAAFESSLRIAALQPLGRGAAAVAELELGSRRRTGASDDDLETLYRFRTLYLQHENPQETLRWRIGRQKLEDDTGFYVDSRLDGVRLSRRGERTRFDLSLTREAWFESGTDERDDTVYNALGVFRFDGTERSRWLPWVLHRTELETDGSTSSRATWVGLQGLVSLDGGVGYWFNGALRAGERRRDGGDVALGGHALDAGLTWTLDRRFGPSFTLAAARASGDDDGSDEDEGFRQSGLHTNEFRLNGRNRFRYLGEVIDPELANLEVLTLGVGTQIDRRWAVDLAWHRYRQVEAEDRLRGTDLRYDPSGDSVELGQALDVIVGFRQGKALALLGAVGLFDPGAAFEDDPGLAWLARLEMAWVFAR